MNIEKVKIYNQKMLAVLSTILVVAATIGLISLIITIVVDLIPDRDSPTNVLLSDDKADALQKDSLRQQIISYDAPQLVDTPNLIYLIPVQVKTLGKPEQIDEEFLVAADLEESKFESGKRSYHKEFYGSFNNLIIYDYKRNSTQKITGNRLIGTDYSIGYFDDEIIIVFSGAERDTDGDGTISLLDFRSLYVYSLNTRQLKKIQQNHATVTSFEYVENAKDMLVNFGYDRNKDNKFDSDQEPSFIMKYEYLQDKLVTVVDKKLEREIQKIIDKN